MPLHVVFRAAAGPRIGFGHVVRCRSLARALGIEASVWLRGSSGARESTRRAGVRVLDASSVPRPSVLVIDDPSAVHAGRIVRQVTALGVRVVSIHDLGLGLVPSDLAIDGSVCPLSVRERRRRTLTGPRYAMLDPAITRWRQGRAQLSEPDRVLIALGGGAHVLALGARLGRDIVAGCAGVRVRIVGGFSGRRLPRPEGSVTWVRAYDGLGEELARATVAVVAGGVTLLEACAIGVPVVTLAVTPQQVLAARAVASAGASRDAGVASAGREACRRVAQHVSDLFNDAGARRSLAANGRRLVDGRGVFRVASYVRRLAGPSERRCAA